MALFILPVEFAIQKHFSFEKVFFLAVSDEKNRNPMSGREIRYHTTDVDPWSITDDNLFI